ncbi:MAG: argininosuccinate lyase [Candidatus Bathyarchaeota archaeon]|nr:argininosuccinate lyase [Candidatus Bathyarchaeota archaeon]
MYRSRLRGEPDSIAMKYMSSALIDDWILEEDIDNTEAHDIMLYEQGIIRLDDLEKILEKLEEIRVKFLKKEISIPLDVEDVHEFLEHYVTIGTSIEVGGKIHTGRSRNDQVATDIRLKVRSELNKVSQGIQDLIENLISLAKENIHTIMVVYTHTQHAQIGTFAHYLNAHIDHLLRDLDRIEDCYKRVNLNPLGSCAISGSSFKLDRTRTTELLGFEGLVENSIDAVSSRDFALEAVSILATLMSNLSRISNDIILWSTSEFGYVEIADEYASTSSAMPQKKNPCTLELIRAKTSIVYGNLVELLTIMKGLPTGYNRDLQETKPPLRMSFQITKDTLELLTRIFSSIIINKERIRKNANDSYATAIDLAEELVRQGLSFREAHKVVGESVKTLVDANKKLIELSPEILDRSIKKIIERKLTINFEKLRNVLNPENALSKRLTRGSANPQEVKRMIKVRERDLASSKLKLGKRIGKIDKSKKLLSKTVNKILS